jgi:hypothetical protein
MKPHYKIKAVGYIRVPINRESSVFMLSYRIRNKIEAHCKCRNYELETIYIDFCLADSLKKPGLEKLKSWIESRKNQPGAITWVLIINDYACFQYYLDDIIKMLSYIRQHGVYTIALWDHKIDTENHRNNKNILKFLRDRKAREHSQNAKG